MQIQNHQNIFQEDGAKPEGNTGQFESMIVSHEEEEVFQGQNSFNHEGSQYEFFLPVQETVPFNLDSTSEPLNEDFFPSDFPEDSAEVEVQKQYTEENEDKLLFEEHVMRELPQSERKKNGNIPKFICRSLVKEFRKHKQIFKDDQKLFKEVSKMVYEEKKKYEFNKNANNTLDDLKKIFCICEGSSNPAKKSFLLRKTMNKILRTSLEELVIFNTQIQLTNEYMIYLKTQALRCRNRTLMCRLKAR